jgi:hypothetical protein
MKQPCRSRLGRRGGLGDLIMLNIQSLGKNYKLSSKIFYKINNYRKFLMQTFKTLENPKFDLFLSSR